MNLARLTQLSEAAMISSGAISNRIDGLERRPDRRDLGAKLIGRTKAGRGVIDPTIDAPCGE